jgi:DNA-directed RNA polymerase subunit beta'
MMRINAVQIGIASPEIIRSWSHGEVKKSETINYRTQKPEYDGLFCERIFGPVRDYECSCGKYKGIRYRETVCERCKVEVISSKVRRERMGHIELAIPITHIWFYKVTPSKIGIILDLSISKLERIIYFESYIVISQGKSNYPVKTLLTDTEYNEIMKSPPPDFVAKTGSQAIYELLKNEDLDKTSTELKSIIKIEVSPEKREKLLKRLDVIEGFRLSRMKPEWMVLQVIPVLPPDLRPLVPLEGGKFATSDLNDLYRKVITRNNRLKTLIQIKAPEIIIRNESRLLQEAVDALLDNSRRVNPVLGKRKLPLKSLADNLKGKQGRFRRNLLGKRVDYSGRSVIVVDPQLKLSECGVPKTMALELFKPFIIRELEKGGYAQTVRMARQLMEKGADEVWEILERIVKNHPVLLNRAPTLHRLSVQAFLPKLVEGKAIRISPLVCPPFNADFDGDTMAIHVPLSPEALLESFILMLSTNNVLSPAHGKPLSVPTQDAVVGLYWLTKVKEGEELVGKKEFKDIDEVEIALEMKEVDYHEPIKYKVKGKVIHTTPGRVIFNKIIPKEIGFINKTIDKKELISLIEEILKKLPHYEGVKFLDLAKDMGYHYSTICGLTLSMEDLVVELPKKELVEKAYKDVENLYNQYKKGVITESERYNITIDIWTRTVNQIEKQAFVQLKQKKRGFNPLHMIVTSGSRGNPDQVRQIVGIRGLMTRPKGEGVGEVIETPIISNFREGLNVVEYFISTHGARKGLTDTALKTAQAGYLSRKLTDVAQDVVITEEDCGTIIGVYVSPIKEGEQIIEPLSKRIRGSFALEDIINPITSEIIVFAGEEITDEKAEIIEECGIEKVYVRSVLTCTSKRGLCQKCYGRDLSTQKLVKIGTPVGVIAAQSIGEPGTQLTLRTFHIGGIATRIAKESEMKSSIDGKIKFKDLILCKKKDGKIIALRKGGKLIVEGKETKVSYKVPHGASVKVEEGEEVEKGKILFEWDPYSFSILAEKEGKVKFEGLEENVTYRLEYDERTGRKYPVVIMHKKIHPKLNIIKGKKKVSSFPLPVKAHVLVKENTTVYPGDLLAKIPQEIVKTRDITGGLPRVQELFEARHPKDKAFVTEIDGEIEFKGEEGGCRIVKVKGTTEEKVYRIPYRKHLLVYEGEEVKAGDKLTDGPIDPHDILRIKGVQATQQYLMNQIQEVYMLQGVEIADKHIGIIVRQMLSKVRIKDPGDTIFVESQIVERRKLWEENEKTTSQGGKGATFEPILLGITQAILTVDSFISAASFQESTRVLTDAAVHGKYDPLVSIKSNVIIGNLIPAGTAMVDLKEEVKHGIDYKPAYKREERSTEEEEKEK